LRQGLFAAPTLKRETFPDFLPKEVGVEVEYRGATAADVEDAVCRRLIEALDGLEDLEELTCTAQDNLASAIARMTDGGQFARFLDDIQSGVAAIDDLPPRAEAPVVRELHRTDLVAAVSVTGPMSAKSSQELREEPAGSPAGAARRRTGRSSGGSPIANCRSRFPVMCCKQHGLSVSDVAAGHPAERRSARRHHRDRSAGRAVRFTDERRTAAALADLVVLAGESGGELKLGDIAEISVGFRPARGQDPVQRRTRRPSRSAQGARRRCSGRPGEVKASWPMSAARARR
jgi:multidrug efflux pump subunit AcrB